MARGDFQSEETRQGARRLVEDLERDSSAEVVVALKVRSIDPAGADMRCAALAGLIVLALLVFLPEPFDENFFVLETAVGMAIGAFLSSRSPALRRWLTSRAAQVEAADNLARSEFQRLGVSRTSGRTGILVFVSLLERQVRLVPDLGVQAAGLKEALARAQQEAERAVEAGDAARFFEALRGLAPALADALPRAADDVNELSDELAS